MLQTGYWSADAEKGPNSGISRLAELLGNQVDPDGSGAGGGKGRQGKLEFPGDPGNHPTDEDDDAVDDRRGG